MLFSQALGKPTAAVLVMGNQYAVDGWIEGVPAAIDAFARRRVPFFWGKKRGSLSPSALTFCGEL